jgi:hypothetical protein
MYSDRSLGCVLSGPRLCAHGRPQHPGPARLNQDERLLGRLLRISPHKRRRRRISPATLTGRVDSAVLSVSGPRPMPQESGTTEGREISAC